MRFQDKVVFVTGAGRGIGLDIALGFAREGAKIAVCDLGEKLDDAAGAKFAETGAEVFYVSCDVTNTSDVAAAVDKILDKYSAVDILINNAGVTRDNLLLRMNEADWDMVLQVNLKGTFNCTKAVSKAMVKKRQGVIISIASIIGQMGNAGQANYAASKAGIIGFTKSIAKELASRNIRVNAIAPGFIETEMTAKLPDETRQAMLNNIPLARFGQPQDITDAAMFLASADAGYITGQVIRVDGGMVM